MGCPEVKAPKIPAIDVGKLGDNIQDQLPTGMSVDGFKAAAKNPSFSSKLSGSLGLVGKNLRATFQKDNIEAATGMNLTSPLKAIGTGITSAIGGIAGGIKDTVTGAIDGISSLGGRLKNFKPGEGALDSADGMFGAIKNKNLQQRIQEAEANRAAQLARDCGDEYVKETSKVNNTVNKITKEEASKITPKQIKSLQTDPSAKAAKEKEIETKVKAEVAKSAEKQATQKPKDDKVVQDAVQSQTLKTVTVPELSTIFTDPPTHAELSAGGVRMIPTKSGVKWPWVFVGKVELDATGKALELQWSKEWNGEKKIWIIEVYDSIDDKLAETPSVIWWKPLNEKFITRTRRKQSAKPYTLYNNALTLKWYEWFHSEEPRLKHGRVILKIDENFTKHDEARYRALIEESHGVPWKVNTIWTLTPASYDFNYISKPKFPQLGLPVISYEQWATRFVTAEKIDCRKKLYSKYGGGLTETGKPIDWSDLYGPCNGEEVKPSSIKDTAHVYFPWDEDTRAGSEVPITQANIKQTLGSGTDNYVGESTNKSDRYVVNKDGLPLPPRTLRQERVHVHDVHRYWIMIELKVKSLKFFEDNGKVAIIQVELWASWDNQPLLLESAMNDYTDDTWEGAYRKATVKTLNAISKKNYDSQIGTIL